MTRYFDSGDIYAISIALPVLATFAVFARISVRRYKKTDLGVDDYLVVLALCLTWGLGIILIDGTAYDGFGEHTATDPQTGQIRPGPNSIYVTKLYYAFVILFILTIGVIKLSVLLLYRRIFIEKTFKQLSLVMLILVITWFVAFFFARVFACGTNFTAFWGTSASLKQYCSSYQAIELGFAVSDVATDLLVLALPVPFIWKLNMPTSQKFAITGIFLLGLLSTAAGVVRLAFLIIDGYETAPGYRDVIGIDTIVLGWSQVEAGIGTVAACLPTLRPLFAGKAPESLINSIRSVFSLRSFGSGRSREQNRQRRGSDGEQLSPPVASAPADRHGAPAHDSILDNTLLATEHRESQVGESEDAIAMDYRAGSQT